VTEHQGDALSQDLVRQQPGLAGRVHYVNGQAWCDGINHTTMCGDDFSDETVTIRKGDLEFLLKVCACYAPYPTGDDIREVTERTMAALRGSGRQQ